MDYTTQKYCKDFGRRFAELRKGQGFTQERLANMVNLHQTYIGYIEQGKRNPTVGTICKIAEALNVEIRDFFPPYD